MYNAKGLTPHDALELNEVMNGEMVTMKMMQLSVNMVQDPDLKTFIQKSLQAKQARMQEMQQFLLNNATSQLQ